MEIAVACLTLIILGVLTFAYLLHRSHERSAREWARERGQLLTRIQHPQIIVPSGDEPSEPVELREREPDEWAQVGQISIDEQYGLTDDDG